MPTFKEQHVSYGEVFKWVENARFNNDHTPWRFKIEGTNIDFVLTREDIWIRVYDVFNNKVAIITNTPGVIWYVINRLGEHDE